MLQLRGSARRRLSGWRWEGSGQGSGRGSEAWEARSAARARGSGRAGQMGGLAAAPLDAGEPQAGSILCRQGGVERQREAGWRWHGSAHASPEPPEPRALGRRA